MVPSTGGNTTERLHNNLQLRSLFCWTYRELAEGFHMWKGTTVHVRAARNWTAGTLRHPSRDAKLIAKQPTASPSRDCLIAQPTCAMGSLTMQPASPVCVFCSLSMEPASAMGSLTMQPARPFRESRTTCTEPARAMVSVTTQPASPFRDGLITQPTNTMGSLTTCTCVQPASPFRENLTTQPLSAMGSHVIAWKSVLRYV